MPLWLHELLGHTVSIPAWEGQAWLIAEAMLPIIVLSLATTLVYGFFRLRKPPR